MLNNNKNKNKNKRDKSPTKIIKYINSARLVGILSIFLPEYIARLILNTKLWPLAKVS